MPAMGVPKFERFFRAAAGLDVSKNDLKRYNDFVDAKLYDLFLIGTADAKANNRDVIEPQDLPVTKGLQESVHAFQKLEEGIELRPLLDQLAARPALGMDAAEETQQRLPDLAGGLSVALARALKTIARDTRRPSTDQWDEAFELFDLLI
ncbi:protein of unknown function [Actinacidiphila yanglinensis]|uniref:DUF1931 family protein n=1 Tax=Actinacidiphila yanglinensis TaxID=310779 RepID=A0A1H6ED86_9ACTN|nr:DUF1931 family protein [Actinacidiphila yanglinensis]SEG95722.1 protein of unknown function [Actinacidiphila yanglinensis]